MITIHNFPRGARGLRVAEIVYQTRSRSLVLLRQIV